jgi:hypothetical protein
MQQGLVLSYFRFAKNGKMKVDLKQAKVFRLHLTIARLLTLMQKLSTPTCTAYTAKKRKGNDDSRHQSLHLHSI